MDWNEIKKLKKFTEMKDVFKVIGKPKFKLGEKPLYYMENGVILSFTSKKFKVENSTRIEYDAEGEYLLSAYVFDNSNSLIKYFELENLKIDYNSNECLMVFEGIMIGMSKQEILNELKNKKTFVQETETRSFENGAFIFKSVDLSFENYTLYFWTKGLKSKLVGFKCLFD